MEELATEVGRAALQTKAGPEFGILLVVLLAFLVGMGYWLYRQGKRIDKKDELLAQNMHVQPGIDPAVSRHLEDIQEELAEMKSAFQLALNDIKNAISSLKDILPYLTRKN